MKLYIAASSKELDRAELWIARAKAAGFRITFDWTEAIRTQGSGNSLPFIEKRGYARLDRDAILDADAVWFLLPRDHHSFGATWEFGFACMAQHAVVRCARAVVHPDHSEVVIQQRSMHVVVSGPRENAHIFTTLADHHFESDEEALEYLSRDDTVG